MAGFAVSAGSVTLTRDKRLEGAVEVVTLDCTSHASAGTVTATGLVLDGELVRVVTNPGGTAPTDDWDFVITDVDGADILAAKGTNRDTANTEQFAPRIGDGTGVNGLTSPNGTVAPLLAGEHSLAVTAAGNSKTLLIRLYLLQRR